MSKEVHEINSALAENLRIAKQELEVAKKKVEAAEIAIYNAAEKFLPPKGTTHVTGVKITTKVTEKWSDEQLAEIEEKWPALSNLPFPFKKTYKADGKSISYIRDNAKPAYDALSVALTITPAKPSFELEAA